MATEEWSVDGIDLSTVAYDITSRDGMDTVPAVVGSNVSFAQTHGERWVRKYFAAASKSLILWVSSRDRTTGVGGIGLDQKRENLDANIDFLTRLFARRNHLLDVRRQLSNGTTRQADCEVVATMDPVTVGLSDAKMAVEFRLPGAFWRDLSSSTLINVGPASNQVAAGLATATAPMVDLEYQITGPITNPKVTDVESGAYFQYNGTVGSGSTLTVRNKTMDVTGGNEDNMIHDGETNWLTLYPTINGVTFSFTGSSTSGATNLKVVGRKAFLR